MARRRRNGLRLGLLTRFAFTPLPRGHTRDTFENRWLLSDLPAVYTQIMYTLLPLEDMSGFILLPSHLPVSTPSSPCTVYRTSLHGGDTLPDSVDIGAKDYDTGCLFDAMEYATALFIRDGCLRLQQDAGAAPLTAQPPCADASSFYHEVRSLAWPCRQQKQGHLA